MAASAGNMAAISSPQQPLSDTKTPPEGGCDSEPFFWTAAQLGERSRARRTRVHPGVGRLEFRRSSVPGSVPRPARNY